MGEYSEAIHQARLIKAREIGREHGKSAASWYFDRTDPGYRELVKLLRDLEDGDPETMDTLPHADLSGEMADGYTPARLAEDVDMTLPFGDDWDEALTELCDEYSDAFGEASQDEIYKDIYRRLGGNIVVEVLSVGDDSDSDNPFDEHAEIRTRQLWPRRDDDNKVTFIFDEDDVTVSIEE
jgi:hypothetical protein